MSTIIQRSLSAGEISPSLQTRVDTSRFQTGLKTLRNHTVLRSGGSQNRAGTEFVGQARYSLPELAGYMSTDGAFSSSKVRLIPFVFNNDQTYILEFGAFYMSVIKDGAYIYETASTASIAVSLAVQATVTENSHGYSNGDVITFSKPTFSELEGRSFYVSDKTNNTFKLRYLDGTYVNSTAFTATGSVVAQTSRIYTIATPYSADELQDIQFVQSADVITIAHQSYAVRELARLADTNWTLTAVTFTPTITAPNNVTNDIGATGGDKWVVTTIAAETFEESLASSLTQTSTTASSGSHVIVSWDAVSGAQEYNVYKYSNGIYGFIGVAVDVTFTDNGIVPDTTVTPPIARNPFSSNAIKTITNFAASGTEVVVTSASHGYSNGDIVYIYTVQPPNHLFSNTYYVVSDKTTNTFLLKDINGSYIDGSEIFTPSTSGSIQKIENYPGVVSYYQQRQLFANTRINPETVYASKSGSFQNFTFSTPTQDDDAVTYNLAGRQVNAVRHLVDLAKLLTFTQSGEWVVEGDDAGVLRPGFVNPKQHSYNGASTRAPVVINGSVVYVQGRGSAVRDISFDYQIDGYRGNDLTIFSNHLFDGYTISDIAYQQIPHSILWCVRSDGTLLGMTYIKEQQIIGWHRHDFSGGEVENICVIPEGSEDTLYLSIKRTIDGVETRYIERMSTRFIDDIKDVKILDAFLTYDGRVFDGQNGVVRTGETMMLSGGTVWDHSETLTLTFSAEDIFASAEIGNEIQLVGSNGDVIRFTIEGYTSSSVVTGKVNTTVPASMRGVAISDWTRAVDTLSGLWHLEGEEVSVFGDGFVVASPNNASYNTITVSGGSITLDRPYGVIHVGLPITSDFQTLSIDSAQGETISDKYKLINRVSLTLEKSRGIWVGASEPTGSDPLEGLNELKIRNLETYNDPVDLFTGVEYVSIRPEWKSSGSVFIRQVDPVPVSILGVAAIGLFPFKQSGGG